MSRSGPPQVNLQGMKADAYTMARPFVLLSLTALACETTPIMPATPTPDPQDLCETFMEMIERERPPEVAALSAESRNIKYQQCLDYNDALKGRDPKGYKEIADCAKVQPWPVNWAVCGFRIE